MSQENDQTEVERLFESAFRYAPTGIVLTSPDGKIIRANRAFSSTVQIRFDELYDRTLTDLFIFGDRLYIYEQVRRVSNKAIEVSTFKSKVHAHNGEKLWVSVHLAPVFATDGKLEFLIYQVHDISSEKKFQDELLHAREDAELANQMKSAFLANMSHEIRTPMHGILGLLQVLKDSDLRKEDEEIIDTLIGSSGSLLHLLNDILDLSKIEAGKMLIESLPFSPQEMFGRLENMFIPLCSEKNLHLSLEVTKDVPESLLGDDHRIQQILVNLISNAIKFTPSNGAIVVVMKRDERSVDRYLFIVVDSGEGISEDNQEKIFDAFVQEDPAIARKFGGTGLGLTIAQHLASLMGGKLQLHSTPNIGTAVSLNLELLEAEWQRPTKDDNPRAAEVVDKELKILVAEDNVVNQKVCENMLKKLGHTVTVVDNGQDVIETLDKEEFDVVLMDILMPMMDGIQATQIIREQGSDVQIVALTANAMTGDEDRYLKAGMNRYLAKPFKKHQLERLLYEVSLELVSES